MNSKPADSHGVIEVRTYQTHPGQRDRLIALMRERALPVHRALGIQVAGPFPCADDPVTLVWLRGYPDPARRAALNQAFYQGPEWTTELEGLLMPLIATYTYTLVHDTDGLRHHWPEPA